MVPVLHINRKAWVSLKFLLFLSRLSVSHSFRFTHAHSCTDTGIQCPRCQRLASSRCLKTGDTSVLDAPPSPPPLATFVGERLAVKSEPTACLSARTSTPPRHKIPLMGTHLLWHHDLTLSISPTPPMWTRIPLEKRFPLTTVSIQKFLWSSTVSKSLYG